MASPLFLFLCFSSLFFTPSYSQRQSFLSVNYYQKTCPRFEQILQDTTTNKQISSPTTAAATLRLFFHDCFIGGCDASVLISSTPFNKAERDADINLSLPGDGFDVVVRAKTALELACPGVVSCADILAVAARNLVLMIGGPYYSVKLGRKDSLTSTASSIDGNLPKPTMPMNQIFQIFESRGFSVQEMVALSGAHTIGFSHCKEFSSILYNYSITSESAPSYNPRFSQALRDACANYHQNPTLSVFNDVMSPNKFDNMYFQNLPKGLGLLSSDHALNSDQRTKGYVDLYANNQTAFFEAFGVAMEKLSVYGVKSEGKGEIRRRCDAFNN
ncbi:peroxidase 31-like [Olea europaea var. sylvestris]|uniref:Peroxidase n=1 Tax=Olea europaea subsp. europaea TaxID=158383 RepID=A0A8S0UQV0_OLEEU|nr:peroxidase 31-like [Olea europaea var. sylvestris]CAA3020400.1 peroxidase 63-like [Olea europaea subsp. europaea]